MQLRNILLWVISLLIISCSSDPEPFPPVPPEPTYNNEVTYELESSVATAFNMRSADNQLTQIEVSEGEDYFGDWVSLFIPVKIILTPDSLFLYKSERISNRYKCFQKIDGVHIYRDMDQTSYRIGTIEGKVFQLESSFYRRNRGDDNRNYTHIGQRYGLFTDSELDDFSKDTDRIILVMQSRYTSP